MSDADLKRIIADWPQLLRDEETKFSECVELDNECSEKTPNKAEAVRQWWQIANSVLWMFTRTRAQYDHELSPFPAYTLARLANIAEELGNGIVPKFVEDVRIIGGGRPHRLKEKKHLAYAVFYIEAVRRGEITDSAPNKTVRQAYNVTARAVQGWVKRRDEICTGVPHKHLTPEELKSKMFECAAVYTRIGRGAPSNN